MTRRLRISALAGSLAAAMALTIGLGTGTAARGTSWTVTPLATGLDSPAGLALTSSGALLVAEGGHGGDVCTPAGALGQRCLGTTGQISKVDVATGAHTPLVTGLYSRSVTLEASPAWTESRCRGRTCSRRSRHTRRSSTGRRATASRPTARPFSPRRRRRPAG